MPACRSHGATLLTAALLILGVGTTAGSAGSSPQAPPATSGPVEPNADDFYRPPPGFESAAPGTVFRTRRVDVSSYGFPVPVTAWQFLVRSTDARDVPTAVVGTLMVPERPHRGTRPLVSYQPATDSLGDQCEPSYTLRKGTEKEFGIIGGPLGNGWAVVVTDYQGPTHAFGAGRMAGHGVLDGIRGALAVPDTGLAGPGTPVGLWGYSGGSLASSWAAELQPGYAPELDVVGVAAGGTPADLIAAARQIDGGPASGLVLLASVGISRAYPEILGLLNDRGRAMLHEIGDMCVGEAVSRYPFRRLSEFTASADPLSEPVAIDVMGQNHLGRQAPGVPVFLYHSVLDELIPFRTAVALRNDWCAAGTPVTFHADPLSEHTTLAATGAPLAVAYLGARFAGTRVVDNCP